SFFFQAEDGIRDRTVTGVQTCALPIYGTVGPMLFFPLGSQSFTGPGLIRSRVGSSITLTVSGSIMEYVPRRTILVTNNSAQSGRSEERRVGKEGKGRWWTWEERESMEG